MLKRSCFYIILREKSPFYDAVCDETPYVHHRRQKLRQHLEKHDKSALSFFCAIHISISVRLPTDRGPAISRFFTREGPTVLYCKSRRDFDPPPGGHPAPGPASYSCSKTIDIPQKVWYNKTDYRTRGLTEMYFLMNKNTVVAAFDKNPATAFSDAVLFTEV